MLRLQMMPIGRGKIMRSLRFFLLFAGANVTLGIAEDAHSPRARPSARVGQEASVQEHLADDSEFQMPVLDLIAHGKRLFVANWTEQDGGGRPMMKGTGTALSDPSQPLVGAHAF